LKEALERLSHKRVEKVPNRTEGVKPALLNLHEHFGNSLESYTFSVLEDFCAGVDLIKQKQDTEYEALIKVRNESVELQSQLRIQRDDRNNKYLDDLMDSAYYGKSREGVGESNEKTISALNEMEFLWSLMEMAANSYISRVHSDEERTELAANSRERAAKRRMEQRLATEKEEHSSYAKMVGLTDDEAVDIWDRKITAIAGPGERILSVLLEKKDTSHILSDAQFQLREDTRALAREKKRGQFKKECSSTSRLFRNTSSSTFTMYSNKEDVVNSMGTPDSQDIWFGSTFPTYEIISGEISRVDKPYNFLLTDPVQEKGIYIAGREGYEEWKYGDSSILFGVMPDCRLRSDVGNCDCSKTNFVIGWFDSGNLKTHGKSVRPRPSKYYKQMAGTYVEDVLEIFGPPFLVQPETTPGNDPHVINTESPIGTGGMKFVYRNIEPKAEWRQTITNQKTQLDGKYSAEKELLGESYIIFRPSVSMDMTNPETARQNQKLSYVRTEPRVISHGKLPLIVNWDTEISFPMDDIEKENKSRFLNLLDLQALVREWEKPENLRRATSEGQTEGASNASNSYNEMLKKSNVASTTKEKGDLFENWSKTLLEAIGYKVEITGASGDQGIDLVAYKQDQLITHKYLVQCKNFHEGGGVDQSILSQLVGMVTTTAGADRAIVMTTGRFTRQAAAFGEDNKGVLTLLDGQKLAALSKQYLD